MYFIHQSTAMLNKSTLALASVAVGIFISAGVLAPAPAHAQFGDYYDSGCGDCWDTYSYSEPAWDTYNYSEPAFDTYDYGSSWDTYNYSEPAWDTYDYGSSWDTYNYDDGFDTYNYDDSWDTYSYSEPAFDTYDYGSSWDTYNYDDGFDTYNYDDSWDTYTYDDSLDTYSYNDPWDTYSYQDDSYALYQPDDYYYEDDSYALYQPDDYYQDDSYALYQPDDYYDDELYYDEYEDVYYDDYYVDDYGYAYSSPSYFSVGSGGGSHTSVNRVNRVNNVRNVSNVSNVKKVTNKQYHTSTHVKPQPNCTINANPSHIQHGNSTTLNWHSNYASSATLSGFGSVSTNGSRTVGNITNTRTYTLNVSGQGGTATCSTTITVQKQAPTCDISANPSSVEQGDSTTITWNSHNATSATLTNAGSVSTSGSRSFHNLQSTKTYTLNVSGPGGSNSCSTTVGVHSTPPPTQAPTCHINVNPSSISQYQSATLSWGSSNATSMTINQGIGSVGTSGSRTVSPNSTRTYTATVHGSGGSNTCSTTLHVGTTSNLSCTITAQPHNIPSGGSAVLNWHSNGNVVSAWLSDGIGSVARSGSLSVRPNTSRNYTLTISDSSGRTQTCNAHVNVGQGGGAPYVSLTSIPYTGAGGPLETSLYFGSMLALVAGAGYVAVRHREDVMENAYALVGYSRRDPVADASITYEATIFRSHPTAAETDAEETKADTKETEHSQSGVELDQGAKDNDMPTLRIRRS